MNIKNNETKSSMNISLLTVFLAVLIDLIGFGIVLPLLPFYASEFHASPVTVGFLFSIFSIAQLVFSPFWGGLSDRIGRRPVMLISTFGAGCAYIIFGLAGNLAMLFISRLIAGIMGGNISTAQAYVADVTKPEERAKGMGLIGAAFGIGFLIGPALAAFLIHPGMLRIFHLENLNPFSLPGFFAAALSFSSFALIYFKLPETVAKNHTSPGGLVRLSIFTKKFWNVLFEDKGYSIRYLFPMLAGCMLLSSFGQSSLYGAFPLFAEKQMHISAGQVGFLFAFMGLIAVLVQGGLIRVLLKRFSEEKLFFAGCILMTLGMVAIGQAVHLGKLFLYMLILALGWSLVIPTLSSMISKTAHTSKIGVTMGISQGMASLGRVIGPTWGGWLYGIAPRLPFLATAAVLILMIVVGAKIKKPGLNTL